MTMYIAKTELLTNDNNRIWRWECVVFAFDAESAKAKIKEYIKTCPHMDCVKEVLEITVKTIAVVA